MEENKTNLSILLDALNIMIPLIVKLLQSIPDIQFKFQIKKKIKYSTQNFV